jgi:hypothetical protein
MGGTYSKHGEMRNVYSVLVGEPEGKMPLGRHGCRRGNNIRIDPREIGWISMDWMHLAEDVNHWWSLVNAIMNLRAP